MAAPKKNAAQPFTPAEDSDPEEVVPAEEALLSGDTDVSQPAQAAEPESAPRTAEGSNDEPMPEPPRPWQVETFSIGEEQWGWRLAAADGTVIRESATDNATQEEAAKAAEKEEFGTTVLMAVREGVPVRPKDA